MGKFHAVSILLVSSLTVACGPKMDPVEHSNYGKMMHTDERYENDFYDCLVELGETEEEREEILVERNKKSLKFMALVNSVELANGLGTTTDDVDATNACLTNKGWTQYRNQR